jgi:hypothetical protein
VALAKESEMKISIVKAKGSRNEIMAMKANIENISENERKCNENMKVMTNINICIERHR